LAFNLSFTSSNSITVSISINTRIKLMLRILGNSAHSSLAKSFDKLVACDSKTNPQTRSATKELPLALAE